jgi:hypothetical protein
MAPITACSEAIAEAETHPGRWPIRLSRDEAQTAGRFCNRAERRLVAKWAGLAETGDAHHDEPGIGIDQVQRVEVPLLQPPGTEVLDEDVALCGQLSDESLVGRVVKVGGNRQLSPRLNQVPERVGFVPGHPPTAQGVAAVRVLDLDDLGAEVGEQSSGEWPGDQGPELEHPQVGEGTVLPSGMVSRIVGHWSSILDANGHGQDCAHLQPSLLDHRADISSRHRTAFVLPRSMRYSVSGSG